MFAGPFKYIHSPRTSLTISGCGRSAMHVIPFNPVALSHVTRSHCICSCRLLPPLSRYVSPSHGELLYLSVDNTSAIFISPCKCDYVLYIYNHMHVYTMGRHDTTTHSQTRILLFDCNESTERTLLVSHRQATVCVCVCSWMACIYNNSIAEFCDLLEAAGAASVQTQHTNTHTHPFHIQLFGHQREPQSE